MSYARCGRASAGVAHVELIPPARSELHHPSRSSPTTAIAAAAAAAAAEEGGAVSNLLAQVLGA